MKRALVLLLLLSSCGGAPAPDAAASAAAMANLDPARPLPQPLPEVVARVNGQEIGIRQILPLAKVAIDRLSVAERDQRKPELIRKALDDYVTRELLLQEALARGIAPDTRDVENSYDQMRREHPDDGKWTEFLSQQGIDPQTFKAELRIQHTVAALLAREVQAWPVPEDLARAAFEASPQNFGPAGVSFDAVRGDVEQAVRQYKAENIQAELIARLRARAKIELFL